MKMSVKLKTKTDVIKSATIPLAATCVHAVMGTDWQETVGLVMVNNVNTVSSLPKPERTLEDLVRSRNIA